ncbi:hypothetical protein QNH48_28080 [Neobacillus sp. YX16]|uniref:hypothetical protein n=1 Tax=Neobacillus sp. YX16 TaxID=3047874 RepID=UPI0024C310EF|nr:hypothetical protein [Neobacillus sp. YX16]WHZ02733.1 hypothetical protein QNH48_28080 [Neobacillus sp. YX16]
MSLDIPYASYRNGNNEFVWIGSIIGWSIFCLALLLNAMTSLIIGIVFIKRKIANYWNVFLLFFGTVGLFSFGYEIFLVPYGIGWVIMGCYLILNSRETPYWK